MLYQLSYTPRPEWATSRIGGTDWPRIRGRRDRSPSADPLHGLDGRGRGRGHSLSLRSLNAGGKMGMALTGITLHRCSVARALARVRRLSCSALYPKIAEGSSPRQLKLSVHSSG